MLKYTSVIVHILVFGAGLPQLGPRLTTSSVTTRAQSTTNAPQTQSASSTLQTNATYITNSSTTIQAVITNTTQSTTSVHNTSTPQQTSPTPANSSTTQAITSASQTTASNVVNATTTKQSANTTQSASTTQLANTTKSINTTQSTSNASQTTTKYITNSSTTAITNTTQSTTSAHNTSTPQPTSTTQAQTKRPVQQRYRAAFTMDKITLNGTTVNTRNSQTKQDLGNSSSELYQNLKMEIEPELLKTVTSSQPEAEKVTITGFRVGSLIVDFLIIFKTTFTGNQTSVRNALKPALENTIFNTSAMTAVAISISLSGYNECPPGYCGVNANCENLLGTYICTCKSGYEKNGISCTKTKAKENVLIIIIAVIASIIGMTLIILVIICALLHRKRTVKKANIHATPGSLYRLESQGTVMYGHGQYSIKRPFGRVRVTTEGNLESLKTKTDTNGTVQYNHPHDIIGINDAYDPNGDNLVNNTRRRICLTSFSDDDDGPVDDKTCPVDDQISPT